MTDKVQNMMPVVIDQFPLPEVERMADYVAKSGLFGVKNKEQAVALMMLAQAEGMHPMIAARDYDIIQGRPSKKAEAMLRDFQRAGGSVQWHSLSDNEAIATFSHPQGGTVKIDWDMKRANAAQLGSKEMWKKFPRQMLRSRTVSEGCKTVWPSATSGMYTPEEARDFEPASNVTNMRDVTPVRDQPRETDANARLQALQSAPEPVQTKAPSKRAKVAPEVVEVAKDAFGTGDTGSVAKPLTWIWIAPDGQIKDYGDSAQWLEALRRALISKSADDCSNLASRMSDTFNELRVLDEPAVEEANSMINDRFIEASNT